MGRSVPNVSDGALPPPELARATQLPSLTPEGVEAAWANREAAARMQVRPGPDDGERRRQRARDDDDGGDWTRVREEGSE